MERIISFLCVVMFTTLASKAQDYYTPKTSHQIYEYEIEDEGVEVYGCHMSHVYGNLDGKVIKLSVAAKKDHPCGLILRALFFNPTKKVNNNNIRLYLKNGEVLTNNLALYDKDHYGCYLFTSNQFISNKKDNFANEYERGKYVMSRLRLYDIIKISINGEITETPNFWSSATIDAMCKDLVAKTGDQGQYGGGSSVSSATKRPANSSSTTETRPNTTSKSSNTTSTSSSLINVPALPKQMTEMQMIMHPFGVLVDNRDAYTQQKVAKDLFTTPQIQPPKNAPQLNCFL